MLQPRRTVLLYITIVILSTYGLLLRNVDCKTEVSDDRLDNDEDLHLHKPSKVDRVKRDVGDVTTVLLVDNTGRHRDGRFNKKAVGLLTSTARTFVQEGTTTEFATQVVGTTLDNGRLYAQVVTTSSRVFFHGENGGRDKTRTKLDELVLPSIPLVADIARPTQPIQDYPSQTEDSVIKVEPFSYAKSGNIYQTAVNEHHTPISRYIGEQHHRANGEVIRVSSIDSESSKEVPETQDEEVRDELEALFLQAKAIKHNRFFPPAKENESEESENLVKAKRMDYFKKRNTGDTENQNSEINDVNPAKVVKPVDGLPTFTIRHDFAPSGFSVDDNYEDSTESRNLETSPKGNRFRTGKSFFRNRVEQRKLDTVTYLGFSDFTTTVGDTVIVFMPHTSAGADGHQGRKATSIAGDATLAPELQHPNTELPVSVVTSVKTFMSHTPGMVTRTVTGHSLSMQTALPTMVVLPETSSYHPSVHSLPQSVTIRRDHKALQSAQVLESITTQPPTDFEDVAQYLANEQLGMAEKTTPTEEIVTEPIPDSETIEPSSVSYNDHIESSIEEPVQSSPAESSTDYITTQTTDSLGYFSTAQTQLFDNGGVENPLGLIKVVGGTEALNGTTTLFTSLVYGTNINGNYAQIIHSTSSKFYFVDNTKVIITDVKAAIQPTAVLDTPSSSSTTTPSPPITTQKDEEVSDGTTPPPTTFSQAVDSTNEQPETTTESNSITTVQLSTTDDDTKHTTKLDETLTTVPMDETTTESDSDSFNEVETGRKISSKPKDQVIVDTTDGKNANGVEKSEDGNKAYGKQTIFISTSNNFVTQLIPSTVYKTFTYLTTFFIPAEGTSTTTSIRSREVTSSEISYSTRIFNPNVQTSIDSSVIIQSNVETYSNIAITPTVSSPQEENLQTTTPGDNTIGTTNVDEPVEHTTVTTPELPEEKTTITSEDTKITTISPKPSIEGEEDEIELIFKTLYTTYTYLTTFFQESTTSVSSREVVVTNVVTSTVDKSYILHASDPAVAGLFARDDVLVSSSIQPLPTSVGIGRPTTKYYPDVGTNPDEDLFSSVIESVDLEKELATPTPVLNNLDSSKSDDNELKTFFTTYTYFTTILVDGETEVESRTEIYTNIVTPSGMINPTATRIEPTISLREPLFENSEPSILSQIESPQFQSVEIISQDSSHIRTPILKSTPQYSYSSTISRAHKSTTEEIESSSISSYPASGVNTPDVDDEENSIFPKNTPKFESSYATISRPRNSEFSPTVSQTDLSSKSPIASREVDNDKGISSAALTSSPVSEIPVVVETMSTDVTSSSSDGGRVMMLEKRNDKHPLLDDQISSESNTEALEPSPTLLLQTSFTTFTYFTTVYRGSTSSDIISRLETITNVVTETLTPSASPTISVPPEDASLPITYFTTFTYWTTLYKDSSTVVTSREETVSNVVTPTVNAATSIVLPITITPSSSSPAIIVTPTSVLNEPTTFYTTYTYFTTSYVGNSTVLSSRLETVTNIVNSSSDDATGRAVGSGATLQKLPTETIKPETSVQPSTAVQPTGLLSTILTSKINNGTTTLFSTDVYGTFIDGLYAQVLESSTQVVTPPLVSPTKVQIDLKPTGIVSLNEGKIVDAMGVSTTFFTTKAIGTYIDALYAEVVESTTSVYINTERQSIIEQLNPSTTESVKSPRTGLVRIVEGSIVKDQTTTYYESKVSGTIIDGRYAQIIESTSSFKVAVAPSIPSTSLNEIAPTSTVSPDIFVTPTVSSSTSPTPAVIESSLSDDGSSRDEDESGDDEDSDENDGKKSKKSRLSYPARKRTFTPVIRPFSSRNRPSFNPKRKTPIGSSATTITRTSVTPTVTATPAGKTESGARNRFNTRRGSSSGVYKTNYNDIRATPTGTGGRRTTRRGSSSSGTSTSTPYSGRGRGAASGSTRLYATSTPGQPAASRRGAFYRSSSGRQAGTSDFRGSTSGIHHGASSSRFRIRPTQSSLIGRGGNTAYTTPSSDETLEPDDDLTTVITEETPRFTDDEQDSQTQPVSTTTESPRRSSNPLLRFRRPPTLRTPQTTSTTPKPTTTQSSRRSPLLRRPANERGSTTQRPRTSTRYNPLLSRQRTNNSLFPPRGLLKKPGKDEEEETKKEEEEDHNEEEHDQEEGGEEQEEDDFDDNDYEGSETSESKTKPNKSANRRSSKAYNPVNIRPFVGFNRKPRTKRQAEYGSKSGSSSSRSFTPRYRRPTSGTSRSQQESSEEQESSQEVAKPKQTNSARFTPRPRSSVTTQPRVRPTTASSNTGRSQFTLRKDDSTTSNRANFKRPTTPSPRRRTNSKPTEPPSAQRPKPPRLKSQSTSRQTDATTFTRSNSARRNPNTSRRGSTRSRYRETDYDTYTYSQTSFDGSITVTHHIPTEVTIPIVNGRVTEYRNVITASPSTEVLGPHQYTVSTAKGGNTMLYLTSEVTGTLPSGATEITQFVIHETPTTSVIFTPTVIRGHKTSYSHIIPSTVYDVEQVVNTLQPQITPNAPLANILLSQLLLGNFGVQPNLNPLLALNNPGPPPTPTTEFKTRQTTYVTTVTKGTSTVLPLTFRGKEILTTIVDSSTEVITATEFITDTIVVTPTASNNQLNSLLLPALLQAQLLGQPQPQPMVPNPLLAGLQQQFLQQDQKPIQDTSFEDLLTDRPPRRRQRPVEEPDRLVRDSDKEILDDDAVQNVKGEDNIRERTGAFKNSRKKSRIDKKPPDPPPVPAETSVVTLYVSGRRPGEFSTVISTVTLGEESSVAIRKREAGFAEPEMFTVSASQVPEIGGSFPTSDDDNGYLDHYVMSAMNEVSGQDSEVETQSLESIVGDVSTYVSSVIGQSSSSSKLGLSKPSLTEKLSSLSTDNKKKHYSKKNIASSSFNSTSFAGHFLSKGPAESAPLKRKVIITQNRGNDDNSSFLKQYSTIETKTQNYNTSESSEQIEDNIDVEETSSSRTKRSTENTSDTPVQRRRRVRVRVPVDKKKITDDLSLSNSEILTVSEAQHRDTIPDMDIAQRNFDKTEQGKQFPQLEYGSRRIKIVRGRKPSSFDTNDDNSEHSHKRVIVTRRRRPEFLTANDNIEDTFTPLTHLDIADIQPTIDDFLPITTYHPKEIPVFISSNMVGEDDRDLYVLPTTVRGENIIKTTPGRRRVVVTKKRPVAITPTTTTHRRRVIVTKKRPVPKVEIEIEPTNVIPESMSTIYSYKYTVLNRENGLNTDDEKVVKVSQVYMSGKIPIENNENDYKVNNENTHEDENTPTDNTNRAYENPETELRSHITPSESVVESNPTSVIPVDISTSNHLSIQASQIESSLQSSSFNLNSETPAIKDLTKEVLDSGEIPTVSPIHPIEASTADPEDATEAIATKTDMEDEPTVDEEEGNEETEDSHDHDNEETLISSEKSVSHVTSSDENTFDGPRFIRPTRFSITRKPGNTKTSFPGKRRSSTTLPSVSSSIQSSFRSSSSKYRSSYRGRKPSSSTRGFGRSSKSNIHLLTTPTSDTIEPTSVYFEDILSSSLTISSSNVFESSVKLSEDSFILYDSSYGSDEISSSLPEPSSTFSDVSSFIGSTLPEPASDRSPDTPILESILSSPTIEPIISSTIVTEVITSTRLRTYTYIVTRVAGEEQVVTSTTEVKPRVTTLTVTKTLPILATEFRGNEEGRGLNMNAAGEARYNLATKVMSNGVEVIVAGDKSTLPGEPEVLRVLSSSLSRPITLAPSTLTDHMVLFLPPESSQVEAQLSSSLQKNVFVTKTYLTTYTYLTTFLQDGTTAVSSHEKIVSNVVTEERTGTNMISPTPIVGVTLSKSPSLATGIFHTTYTYLNTLLDGDVPLVVTSHKTVANTLTAPQDYLLQLQPSGDSTLDTNTYLSTVAFTKTLTEGDDVKIVSTKDILTQVVITESAKKPTDVKGVPESSPVFIQPSQQQGSITNIVKTYFVTYTYFSTFLEGGSTVIRSNIATSSDVVTEKFYVSPKRTMPPSLNPSSSLQQVRITPSSKLVENNEVGRPPLHLYATKTYLTTFTYFTTLLQDGGGDRTSTIVSSRTNVVQNVVTESVDTNLLDPEYLESLRSSILAESSVSSGIVATATLNGGQQLKVTAMDHIIKPSSTLETQVTPTANHHELSSSMEELSSNPNNIITGSTIIFFDEEDQIDSSSTSRTLAIEMAGHTKATPSLSSILPASVIQSTVINSGSATVLFPEDVAVAQPLVSSSSSALSPEELGSIGLPSSIPFPVTFSPVGIITSILATSTVTPNGATLLPGDQVIMMTQAGGNVTMIPVSDPAIKKPGGGGFGPGGSDIEVSDLLSLGSLGINGLNALGPVINAMAGLIQSNLNTDKRRNDTTVIVLPSTTSKPQPVYFGNNGNPSPVYVPPKPLEDGTTVRSPIYIPVGAAAGDVDDVDTAESQQYEGIVNLNGDVKWPAQGFPDTNQRRPVDSAAMGRPIESALLGDGIPISPGQVITANSDVIVGKPAIMGPRPPKINNNKDEIPLGMKPPPLPPPPVWPNRDVSPTHIPVRDHGHIPLPPVGPMRNQHTGHSPLRDHVLTSHREQGHHASGHHLPTSEGLPLLPPPMPRPELGTHLKVEHENLIPAKVSPVSGLQTVFLGKPIPPGNEIIHGNPVSIPNVLDRSSGTPLLVNIQPSQVANVIIPSSTAPHIFNEHGTEFYDPSPYPLPESSPGFIGIDGPENNPHNIHVGHHKHHVNQVSGTRMDLPIHEAESLDHVNDNISPQGINVEISPGQGINVDVSPGQGINVDVSPGQGLNVEIAPGHFSQHGLKHDGERISPSGIVLDVPLQGRPGNEILIGSPGRRPVHNVHENHRPAPPPLSQQIPPPPPPHRIPPNKHVSVSTSTPNNHKFPHNHPRPPTDFMMPPPPPAVHVKHDSFHNSGNFHGPVIPLNPNGPHTQGPKTEDLLIQSDDKDDPLDIEEGEIIQESNQRPVRPGQIPVEVQLSNSASTHRPVVVRPPANHGLLKHDEALHQMKPPQSMFDKPLLPDRPIKPHPELRPNKPNHKDHPHLPVSDERPHRPKPQANLPKRPHVPNNHQTQHSHVHGFDEIAGHSKPEVLIENRPFASNNRHPIMNKPDDVVHKPPQNHRNENIFSHHSQSGKPSEVPLEINLGGPHQTIFDKHDDIYKSTSGPIFDLETQANTPRPFSVVPPPKDVPDFDFNSDEIVVGLSPPPPRVTPVSNNGQRYPVLGIEPQISTHRPVVNIGGQRRPPNRNKPRPQPPYKFELPETTLPTTELPTTTQKTSTKRPFWIRPAIHEVSSPTDGSKPNRNEDENFIKKPSSPQDLSHTHRRPITTWRPPLVPERPRPVKPLPAHTTESTNLHSPANIDESSIHLETHKIIPGSVKPIQSAPTPVLQTVVIGKPIPQEPVISPTSVKDSIKKKPSPSTDFLANEDIIVGSENSIMEIQSHATPSVSVYRKQPTSPAIASTVVTSGSKTIYGNLYTKPSLTSVSSVKPSHYKPSTVFVEHKDHKYSKPSHHVNNDNDDEDSDDDLEFEDKVNHKTDLGVASSNEDRIIYSSIAEVPTRYVTHTHTHTVTFTETTVISSRGHQPSTRTIVVTKTQTSTVVDTVTETQIHTLVKPTSIIATVTTTVSATPSVYPPGSPFDPDNYPAFPIKPVPTSPEHESGENNKSPSSTSIENESFGDEHNYVAGHDNNNSKPLHPATDENESFFVVVNDQKPATFNINKGGNKDGDYGKDDEVANRDESDPNNEVNHAVLLGGVLIAAPPHHNTPSGHPSDGDQGGSTCRPDCSAARNELCQRVEGRMRCVCRPGFARMFPDRPCKPTYTYTMQLGLLRHGKETLHYDETLTDHTTPEYHQLAEATREGLDRMVMQSDLRDIYHGVIVNGFQPIERDDGVNVNFYVQLSDNTDESRLQDVFRKSLRTSNYSLGGTEMFAHREFVHHIRADDFDECASSHFHDCSEHAQCFNLRGTYTCSCQDGYTDLSENPLFPGRLCSAELIGCEKCHYHGTCYSRGDDQHMCECFQWYAGENCQINLKVLLIALVTIGAILLGLLVVCVVLTCLKRSSQRVHSSGTGFLRYRSPTHTLDKRAMIQDSSSEGSVADHGPISYLTPTHQPAGTFGSQMKPALVHASGRKVSGTVELSDEGMTYSDQRDRSLTVMIPRAKYRPIPPTSPLLAMSTFGVEQKRAIAQEQQKLLSYLETGNKESRNAANARRKQSNSTNQTNEVAPAPSRKSSAPRKPSTGALVSAGFEVSATVGRKEPDSDTDIASAAVARSNGGEGNNVNNNTLASNGSHFTTLRTNDSEIIESQPQPTTETAESTVDSQQDANSRVQELTVSEARSFDETTVQPPTKSLHSNYGSNPSSRNPNDEAHTMAERDLGSTLLMPQTHLYKPDRGSDISNFDSL